MAIGRSMAHPDPPSRVTLEMTRPEESGTVDVELTAPQASGSGYENYVVSGEVGRGGLGRVLKAYDLRLDRRVALKEALSGSAYAHARFQREARLTARLQHPSIVPIYETGKRGDGTPYYAMKLIAGEPLSRIIAGTQSLEERLALLRHVLAIAEAMAYAHERGIIHRDLKPANVVVGAFGETMVIDWGIAKDLSEKSESGTSEVSHTDCAARGPRPIVAGFADTLLFEATPSDGFVTREGGIVGTPAYMSPEQRAGGPVDARTDVFSLGMIHVMQFQGKVGGGVVTASGGVVYRPQLQFDLAMAATGVRVLYHESVRATLNSNLALTGNPDNALMSGQVAIDQLSFTSDFDISDLMSQFGGEETPRLLKASARI